MERAKKELLEKTYREFMEVGLESNEPKLLEGLVDKNIMGFGTAIDEKILGIEEFKNLLINQKIQSQGLDIAWRSEPVHRFISEDENSAVYAENIYATIKTGEEAVEMFMRFSSVLNYSNKQWKVVHWHGSKPEQVASEKDTWGIDIWKQKTEELEKLVEEKTADLLKKNRELEIEAAIERVRARTMAMQHSDELMETSELMFEQIKNLGIELWSCGFSLWYGDDSYFLGYNPGPNGKLGNPLKIPLTEDIFFTTIREAKRRGDEFLVFESEGESLAQTYRYMDGLPVVGETMRSFVEAGFPLPTFQVTHCGFFTNGHLMFILQEHNSEAVDIFKRFTKVFNQTYTRFLDLQKAEAQAREAQIEAALERVRSRTMAMHKSDELLEIGALLFQEASKLGINIFNCGYVLMDDEAKIGWNYGVNPGDGSIRPLPTGIPQSGTNVLEAISESWKKQEPFLLIELDPQETIEHQTYVAENSPNFSLTKEKLLAISPERIAIHTFNFKHGYLLLVDGAKLTAGQQDMARRFAKVFEQTYTRFLDLEKAEFQAREATIEAALEKVRSRSLAMHKSDELNEVVAVLFEKLKDLKIPFTAVGIATSIEDSKDLNAFVCGQNEAGLVITNYRLPYFENPVPKDLYHALEKQLDFFEGHYSKEEKDAFYHHLIEHTEEFKHLPEDILQMIFNSEAYCISMIAVKNAVFNINDFEGKSLAPHEIDIINRFARVFEQAYTRFLDLQKAEAQARESEIQLALERVRARSMAMKSTDELHEVLSVLFRQFDQLGIHPMNVYLSLFDRENRTLTYRASGKSKHRQPQKQVVHVNSMEELKGIYDKFINDKSDSVEVIFYSKEVLPQVFEIFSETFDAMPEDERMKLEYFPEGGYSMAGYTPFGYLGYDHLRPATSEEKEILSRFCKEFTRVYQRFLDIQKAEAQAREAQIETSLERIRARAMAMHHTDELTDVLCVLFEQFDLLGINPVLTHLTLFDEANETFSIRLTTTADNGVVAEQLIDIHAIDAWKQAFAQWKSCEPNSVNTIDYAPEDLPYLWELLSEVMGALPEGHKINPKDFPKGLFTTQGHFQFGYLGFNHSRKATEEEKSIVSRFAREFGRAYQRFLDLQKAEAQAKEAQIEAALEKVRSRSMGMQNTTEMQLVANEIREQLLALGVPLDAMAMSGVIDNDSDYDVWVGGAISEKPLRITHSSGTQVQREYNQVIKERPELFMKTYSGKIMKEYYQQLLDTNSFNPEIEKFMKESSAFTTTLTFMKNSGLQILRYTDEPFSDSDNQIVIRFGKVFEQAYIRFLDLQKAEAQAREARIEAALEKIRSRTMGMQSSAELPEVANLLFLEVQALGIPAWSCGYNILSEDKKTATCCMSSEGTLQTPFQLRLYGEASFDEMGEFIRGDDTMLVQELGGKALEEHYTYMKSFPDLKPTFDEIERLGLSLPTYQINHLCKFNQGFILFITYEKVPDSQDIFKRFTKVFDQTYTRFLDLKKAEAQAREAKIEAALERIRSHSMGMQSAADFGVVTTEMFDQLRNFGEDLFAAGIVFCDKHEGHVEQWHSIPGGGMLSPFIVPIDLDYIHQYRYDQWKAGKELFSVEIPGDFIEQHFKDIFDLPSAQVAIKDLESRNAPMPAAPPWEIDYGASFKNGYILISSLKYLETTDILPRFAKVFEQAYTRFLDLQKAEEQARNAQIEASMERVRARAMSMQKPDELVDVATLLRKEMGLLGVEELETSSIYIHHADEGTTECWYAIQDDKKLISDYMTIRLEDTWVGEEMLSFYQSDSSKTSIKMQGQHRTEWISYCAEKSHHFSIQEFYGDQIPERTYHLYKFSHGFMGAASPGEISEESWKLLKRATSVFSLAYTRFSDLKQAEAQAREAQIEAALERVRSRTMGMQRSEELSETASVLFEQLQNLGVTHERINIGIINEKNQTIDFWITAQGGNRLDTRFSGRISEETTLSKAYQAWKKGKKSLVIDLQGEELDQWLQFMKEEIKIPFNKKYQHNRRVQTVGFFSKGMLVVTSPEPLHEEALYLLEKFAGVFDLTYTRFTDLKIAEANAVQAEKDLEAIKLAKSKAESALKELKAAQEQLIQQEKLASLGQLTAGIAHEIKNPLNFVNNFSELSKELIEEVFDELAKLESSDIKEDIIDILTDVKSNLTKVHEHGSRADGIVKSMLQHSRGGAGKATSIGINELVREFSNLAFHGMRAGKNPINVNLNFDLDENAGEVTLVMEDFSRVILNIANNAFDAMRDKLNSSNNREYLPSLDIKTKRQKNQVLISIQDNGPGIPDDIKDKILQPFFTTKKGTEGTGLGLSITHDIVKAHGGELEIETALNKGTNFMIKLKK
ncbi:ATP-binding protein [Algoriphagus algorifonticola]|uniref:ATP-binding protein n=1 Tax=Algoriphagus algorifonticola TaxID=2593007 RepID=UPI0011A8834D|nr:ATP-binding protein [Algoriphagus algorifonticola]